VPKTRLLTGGSILLRQCYGLATICLNSRESCFFPKISRRFETETRPHFPHPLLALFVVCRSAVPVGNPNKMSSVGTFVEDKRLEHNIQGNLTQPSNLELFKQIETLRYGG